MNNLAHQTKGSDLPHHMDSKRQVQQYKVKARLDDGYYRVANQLGYALCKIRLSDRESRLLQAVIMKTFGFRKALDWICYRQLAELTGIDRSNIGKTKALLLQRKILITEGKKIGVNLFTEEWLPKSTIKSNKVVVDSQKGQRRLQSTESQLTCSSVDTDVLLSRQQLQTELKSTPTKENKYTKDNITKDIDRTSIRSPAFKQFFALYPAHRKGGRDTHAWETWKSENLSEQDAVDAINWLNMAARNNMDWQTGSGGQFVYGITKFIKERLWLTPIPQRNSISPLNTRTSNFCNEDTSWANDLGW